MTGNDEKNVEKWDFWRYNSCARRCMNRGGIALREAQATGEGAVNGGDDNLCRPGLRVVAATQNGKRPLEIH
jgi:hypothetical protein